MEGTTSYYEKYAGRPWRVSIQRVLGAAPYRHGIGGFDDPGWGRAVYTSSLRIGVEVQPVAVDGKGVSTSLNPGNLWLTARPTCDDGVSGRDNGQRPILYDPSTKFGRWVDFRTLRAEDQLPPRAWSRLASQPVTTMSSRAGSGGRAVRRAMIS